jgi:glycosyltransferase involved in cell wall biosynthesis
VTELSVVVPVFNAESFVPTAVESLRQNWFEGIEYVLVDDCSTDDTRAALESHAEGLPGARVVSLEQNVGLASARNAGMDAASGRYVTFFDVDDWLAPGYLRRLRDTIFRLDCDFVRVDHVQVFGQRRQIVRSPEGRRDRPIPPRDSILPADRSTGIDYPYSWAGIFDTTRVPAEVLRFPPGLRTCEDRPWIWRLYLSTQSHAVVGMTGLFYRREVQNSLTQIGDERQLDFLDAYELVMREVNDDDEADRFMPKAVRAFCAVIASHLQRDRRFSRPLRRELHRRSAVALDSLPPDVLRSTLQEMADRRAVRLRRLQARHRALRT